MILKYGLMRFRPQSCWEKGAIACERHFEHASALNQKLVLAKVQFPCFDGSLGINRAYRILIFDPLYSLDRPALATALEVSYCLCFCRGNYFFASLSVSPSDGGWAQSHSQKSHLSNTIPLLPVSANRRLKIVSEVVVKTGQDWRCLGIR